MTYILNQSMNKAAYSFKSSATYQAGAIPKRSTRSLWAARRLCLMTREVTSKPSSRTSSPTIKTLRLPGTSLWQTRHGTIGNTLRCPGCSASLISLSGAPPRDVASRWRTTSHPQIRSSEVSTPFIPTTPLDVFLRSCESLFLETNLILGI